MNGLSRIFVIFVIFGAVCRPAPGGNGNAEALRVLTRDTSAIGGPALRHGAELRGGDGHAGERHAVPFADLYERIMLGFVTGTLPYDVLLIPSAWLPDFAPFLSPTPQSSGGKPGLCRHPPHLPRCPDALARPLDGPNNRRRSAHGCLPARPVRGPGQPAGIRWRVTVGPWNRPVPGGSTATSRPSSAAAPPRTAPALAGTLEAYARGGQRIWYLFSHAAAYASHPDHPGGMFFDPYTMVPAIDNPAWVRALEEFLDVQQFGPADAPTLDSEAVRRRFADGEAAMDIDWADTGVLAGDPRRSRVAGKLGFFPLPGSREVWNPTTRQWDRLAEPRSVTFLAFGGWIGVVPAASPHRDQAWSYLAWYASPEHSGEDVLDGSSGINPYRRSQLDDPAPWQRLLGDRDGAAYLEVLRTSLSAPDLARDLRLPGYRAYISALEDQLDRVMAGEVSPAEGLQAAARSWETLTDRLGRSSQRRHYRQAMGLPVDQE